MQARCRLRWLGTTAGHAAQRGPDERYKGAALTLDALRWVKALIGDRGYDADWLRAALADRKIAVCIQSKVNRKVPIPHDKALYRQPIRSKSCSVGSRTGAASKVIFCLDQ